MSSEATIQMPVEMDFEMQMVWQTAWHRQSVVRHKARFKPQQPISCEEAAWAAVVALIKGRAKVARREQREQIITRTERFTGSYADSFAA